MSEQPVVQYYVPTSTSGMCYAASASASSTQDSTQTSLKGLYVKAEDHAAEVANLITEFAKRLYYASIWIGKQGLNPEDCDKFVQEAQAAEGGKP